MGPPPHARSSPAGEPVDNLSSAPQPITAERQADRTRYAEDAELQLIEARRFLDAADHILLAALLDGDDPVGSIEGAVLLLARSRGFLDYIVVRAEPVVFA